MGQERGSFKIVSFLVTYNISHRRMSGETTRVRLSAVQHQLPTTLSRVFLRFSVNEEALQITQAYGDATIHSWHKRPVSPRGVAHVAACLVAGFEQPRFHKHRCYNLEEITARANNYRARPLSALVFMLEPAKPSTRFDIGDSRSQDTTWHVFIRTARALRALI